VRHNRRPIAASEKYRRIRRVKNAEVGTSRRRYSTTTQLAATLTPILRDIVWRREDAILARGTTASLVRLILARA